jgi:inhibitor of KinA sporulation pathway (predicted exonuclease)
MVPGSQVVVKPSMGGAVSAYSAEVTGITAEDLAAAISTSEMIEKLNAFWEEHCQGKTTRVITDGPWDLSEVRLLSAPEWYQLCYSLQLFHLFSQQCLPQAAQAAGVALPSFCLSYSDLRQEFQAFAAANSDVTVPEGELDLSKIANSLNVTLEDGKHNGLRECTNISRVIDAMIARGHKFELVSVPAPSGSAAEAQLNATTVCRLRGLPYQVSGLVYPWRGLSPACPTGPCPPPPPVSRKKVSYLLPIVSLSQATEADIRTFANGLDVVENGILIPLYGVGTVWKNDTILWGRREAVANLLPIRDIHRVDQMEKGLLNWLPSSTPSSFYCGTSR